MPDFKTFAEAVTAASPAINVAGQLGHGSLRGGVVGAEARAATDDELRRMCEGIALAAEQAHSASARASSTRRVPSPMPAR
jgi:N-acyl-D-aspartate/D-glutamate deacylase